MVESFCTELSSAAAYSIAAHNPSEWYIKLLWIKKKLEVDKFPQILSPVAV